MAFSQSKKVMLPLPKKIDESRAAIGFAKHGKTCPD